MEDREQYQRTIREERARISRDLHDDLGAKLLSILQQAKDERIIRTVEESIEEMRMILDDLQGKPHPLPAALGMWRLEMDERCTQAGIALQWQQPDAIPNRLLNVRQYNNMRRVLRELLTNAIRHAESPALKVDVMIDSTQMTLTVTQHGGNTTMLSKWGSGRGTQHIRKRMADIDGECVMKHDSTTLTIWLRIPWSH